MNIALILASAICFGITMKIADLLNEHGLKWFKGSTILFGCLWGILGIILELGDNIIANILLAMNMAFLPRNRLDYINHQIASSMIILVFLLKATFLPVLFFAFYFNFLIFGSLRDYIGDRIVNKNYWQRLYDNVMWYYIITPLIYCLLYGNWIIFWTFTFYSIAYDTTKYLYKKKGYV